MISERKEKHWRQKGRLVMWEYEKPSKGFRGIHITCDIEGCKNIISLLEEFLNVSSPRYRSITISRPTDIELKILNYDNTRFWSPSKLRFVSSLEEELQETLELEREDDKIVIVAGKQKIKELIECFRKLLEGKIDFSLIGDNKLRLNFW